MSATPPFASALEISECESTIGFLDELAHPRLCLHERSRCSAQALDPFFEQSKCIVQRHLGSLKLADNSLNARDVRFVAHFPSSAFRIERAVARTMPSRSKRSKSSAGTKSEMLPSVAPASSRATA